MAFAGVSDVYSKSNDLLNAFLEITISESQVYRVTDRIGNQMIMDSVKDSSHPQLEENQRVYASIDGSLIQMDQGWKEVKLGRIFLEHGRTEKGTKAKEKIRYKLDESIYSGHLGLHTDFIPKFEASLGGYKHHQNQLVFIVDGAAWIQQYLIQRFPNSTHILDFFHAKEHLTDFAKVHFKKSVTRHDWIKKQETEL